MEELEALAQELLPEGHEMRGHLDRSMRMLQVPRPFSPSAPLSAALAAIWEARGLDQKMLLCA